MGRTNRDKYENFYIILSALDEVESGELSTYRISGKLYGEHAGRFTTRTRYFLMQLLSADAVTGYSTDISELWTITTKGLNLLMLYRKMMRLFPDEFKGHDVKELELRRMTEREMLA